MPDKEKRHDRWGFPSTIWSDVIDARDKANSDYKEKLGYLVSMYWDPVYRIIRSSWNKSDADSRDLAQEFFATFLEKDFLKSVTPDKGRFRTFVKVTLKHFLLNHRDKLMSQKRGGGSQYVSIQKLKGDPAAGNDLLDPVEHFDREWAKTIIERSISILKRRLEEQGKDIYFKVFELIDMNYNKDNKVTYEDISKQFDIKKLNVKNYINYTRQLLKRIIRREVGNYVLSLNDVEEELKFLLSIRL